VLQTEQELSEGTHDVLEQLHSENVRLCEIRFCPNLHTMEGLSAAQAVRAVVAGFKRGAAEFNMVGGVILCGLRSHTPAVTKETANLCGEMTEETGGVVLGFDIAGDEGSYPIIDHMPSLQRARDCGVGVTCHAGEWPVDERFGTTSLDNLRAVLQSPRVSRVGHGIQLVADPVLLRQEGLLSGGGTTPVSLLSPSSQGAHSGCVYFECCLTANVGWKIPSYAKHPASEMVRAGVKVALCCDNLLLSGAADRAPTPSGEIIHFLRDLGMTYNELEGVLLNGAHASFVFRAQQWSESTTIAWLGNFEKEVRNAIASALSVLP